MPEIIDEEPIVTIRRLIVDGWDTSNMTWAGKPRVHTGWWDWKRPGPEVTVTNPEDNPLAGGDTGYTYVTGDGRVGQRRGGYCLVNAWGGTFDTPQLETEGAGGSRLSPKVNAWEMCKEVRRILLDHADGGDTELLSIAPDTGRRIIESDVEKEHPTLFRYEIQCRFTYHEES